MSIKVGTDIDTTCNRCQLELAHVVVAMSHGKPVRVQCKTCRTEHAFRGGATRRAKTSASASRRAPAKPRGAAALASSYEQVMQGKDVSRAQRYKVSQRFAEGDILDHQNFGLGVVTRVLADEKLEAIFQGGIKVLAHGRV